MSSKRIKIFAGIFIIAAVILFVYYATHLITSGSDFTPDERSQLLENFSPLRIILFAISGFGIAYILDGWLKRFKFFGSEKTVRAIKFFIIVCTIFIILVVMLSVKLLYWSIPAAVVLTAAVQILGKKFLKPDVDE